jgi:hypothetical protein
LKHLDAVGPVRKAVEFDQIPGLVTTVVALTHPSLRHASVRHRRYDEKPGDDAELAMFGDAYSSIHAAED